MRLIDADELKKAFEGTVCIEPMPYAFVKQIIDNAPTIKTFTLLDIEEQYRKGLEKGLSEWETERPQGEWIIIDKYSDDYKCSVCNSYPLERGDYPELSKFCPFCGAEMEVPND